jgi:hypothetical protein
VLDIRWEGEVNKFSFTHFPYELLHCSHICGLMANHLNFRMERIIALDPARPLIRPGNQNRLDTGDAKAVQVITRKLFYLKALINSIIALAIIGNSHKCRVILNLVTTEGIV